MRRSTAILDRVVAGLLGLILISAGLLGVAARFDLRPFSEWTDGLRPSRLPGHVDAGWFTWALAIAAILSVVLAVGLLAANVDRRLTGTKIDDASDDSGEIRYHLADIADGLAKHLSTRHGIRRAKGRAEIDRGREVITITLDLAHDADLEHVRRACDESAQDIDAAIGDGEFGTRFLLHLDRPPGS